MKGNLKLFHRALILVSVPLVFQIVFVVLLFVLLQQAEVEKEHEQYVKNIMAKLSLLKDSFVESVKTVGPALILGRHDVDVKYHQAMDPIPGELKDLQETLRDDEKAQDILDNIAPKLDFTISVLNKATKHVSDGNRIAAVLEISRLKTVYSEIIQEMDVLENYINSIEQEFPKRQEQNREIILSVLWGGIAFNIVLALFLAWNFNRGATRRLSVLVDNTQRMAGEVDLLPPVGGGDEIMSLDETFREMARALRLSFETEQKILQSIPVGLALTTESGQVQIVNSALCDMFRCQKEELMSRPIGHLFNSESHIAVGVLPAPSNGDLEFDTVRRDGSGLSVVLTQRSILTAGGDRHLTIIQDITQRKEVDRFKQEFLSMVSHDLRTPLTSIRFFVEMLEGGSFGQINEEYSGSAKETNHQIDRLINLINDVLDMEKLESGSFELVTKRMHASSFIDAAAEGVSRLAAARRVKVKRDFDTDAELVGDMVRLTRVFTDILENAIMASPEGGLVQICLENKESSILIKVIDHGSGIPSNQLESIFEQYKPVVALSDRDATGAGLSLPICKALVVKHHGAIGASSQEGIGSTFWVELPVVEN
jgi:PAS domain S-box-containing protein